MSFARPPTPLPLTPTPAPPTAASPIVQGQTTNAALTAGMKAGAASTMLTGPMGLSTTATNAPKSLLGG